MRYDPQSLDSKWQEFWRENKTYRTENTSEKPKYYVLDMFPYPSGAGLHVGHPLGYIASDIVARYKRHKGFNVLHPMGYDSFGLPAEQYAIQTGQHPAVTTQVNIEGGIDKQGNQVTGYENQLRKLGLSFDWDREIRTSNPDYYKWTQWIFLELFEHYYDTDAQKALPISGLVETFEREGNVKTNAHADEDTPSFLAEEWNMFSDGEKSDILLKYRLTYLAEAEVNWCPGLGTVLANDEVVNGVSERGGYPVVRKKMKQWMMRITAYADRLLKGLENLDWPQSIKELQSHWIGKSKGAQVQFSVQSSDHKIEVFTTRPDTIFGVSFMTLAPEHELVEKITTASQKAEVETYVEAASRKSERERMADTKTISGVFSGAYAVHPFTKEPIPIWIGDYVLAGYGTGAVMAVPAGDERDYAFANHFGISIPNIFNRDISENAFSAKENFKLINSDFLDGLNYGQATEKIIEAIEKAKVGFGKVNFRLREAVFSRQRYWGEPVPIFFEKGSPIPISREKLPIALPEIEKYLPTKEGNPPLGRAEKWAWSKRENKIVPSKLIDNDSVFSLELNTMPGWAGSSWYFNRYMDPKNDTEFASKEALNYWKEVDLYLGGSEHATGHLLYSRFWQMFLFDTGKVPVEEYAKKLINQGMIQGESAFIHRKAGRSTYVSMDVKKEGQWESLHVDLSLIDESNNTLNVEALKKWRPEFESAEFINSDDGKFYVSREVEKMSKSKYNVINPDDICEEYGADTLRMYEMFLGPLEQSKPWNTQGIGGVHGFLKKYWKWSQEVLSHEEQATEPSKTELKILHQTIKKTTEDIENFSFNTSVSQFMIAVNEFTKIKSRSREVLETFTILLSPFAPHVAEEIWQQLGNDRTVEYADWPKFSPEYLVEDSKEYPISFNGKVRFKLKFPTIASKEEIEAAVLANERTQKQLDGKSPKKVIVVPNKIVNIVV